MPTLEVSSLVPRPFYNEQPGYEAKCISEIEFHDLLVSPLFLAPPFLPPPPHLLYSHTSIMKVLISAVGQEFNFLDNFEYMYDSSSESETPGPFTWSFQALNTEYREDEKEEEREEEREDRSANTLLII